MLFQNQGRSPIFTVIVLTLPKYFLLRCPNNHMLSSFQNVIQLFHTNAFNFAITYNLCFFQKSLVITLKYSRPMLVCTLWFLMQILQVNSFNMSYISFLLTSSHSYIKSKDKIAEERKKAIYILYLNPANVLILDSICRLGVYAEHDG